MRHCGPLLFALLLVFAPVSSAQIAPQTAAVVNGEEITVQEVDRAASGQLRQLSELRDDSQSNSSFERAKLAARWEALNYLIERKLIRAEAARLMISEEAVVRRKIEDVTPEATPEAAEAFLAANKERMPLVERLSHAEAISQIRGYLSIQNSNAAHAAFVDELSQQYGAATFLDPPRLEVETSGFPARGAEAAPVTIVEFTDFACPDCAALTRALQALQEKNTGKLRLVYRPFPLAYLNADAQKAAEASLCANDQQHFWEFHDSLFGNQSNLKPDDLKKRAADLQLDASAFNACLESGKHAADLDKEIDAAYVSGIITAPTIFINGRKFSGNRSVAQIQHIIDDELKRAPRQ